LFQTLLHDCILGRVVGKGCQWRFRDRGKVSVGDGKAFFNALAGTVGLQHVGNPGIIANDVEWDQNFIR
jgi:hypothetical protein